MNTPTWQLGLQLWKVALAIEVLVSCRISIEGRAAGFIPAGTSPAARSSHQSKIDHELVVPRDTLAGETGKLVYPEKTWETRTPAAADLEDAKLAELRDYVGGRGCVIRHGYLVYSWGDVCKRADVASACKPWFTHFLFTAIEQGRIKSVDDPVLDFEPRLRDLNAPLAFKDRKICWRNLACQTSCYGVAEPPGEAFDYSDFQMALFFDTLFLKALGSSWERLDEEVLHPRLTSLLECEDAPTLMAFGTGDRPGRLAVSVRDFARFGLLYLRNGNWNGKQLIDAKHVVLAVNSPVPNSVPRTRGQPVEMIPRQRSLGGGNNQTDHLGSYSFAWWTNGVDRDGNRHWPDAPHDTYGAFGHAGLRAMVVVPNLDLVVSWNDAKIEGREKENQALKLLKEAAAK